MPGPAAYGNKKSKLIKKKAAASFPDLGHLGPGKPQGQGIVSMGYIDSIAGLPPRDFGWGKAKRPKKRR